MVRSETRCKCGVCGRTGKDGELAIILFDRHDDSQMQFYHLDCLGSLPRVERDKITAGMLMSRVYKIGALDEEFPFDSDEDGELKSSEDSVTH